MRQSETEYRDALLADIRQRLKSNSEVERLGAVQATILVEDIAVIPLLLQMLREDPCPQVRATTALAIGILAKSVDRQAVLSHLAEVMCTDPYDQVRAMAAGAMRLLSMGTRLIADNPALVEACLKALRDPHPQVVMAATRLLEEVQSDEVDGALQQVLTHPCSVAKRGGRCGITPAEKYTDAREPICPYRKTRLPHRPTNSPHLLSPQEPTRLHLPPARRLRDAQNLSQLHLPRPISGSLPPTKCAKPCNGPVCRTIPPSLVPLPSSCKHSGSRSTTRCGSICK